MQPPYAGRDAPVLMGGWVNDIDASDSGPRVRLLVCSIEGVTAPPRYVRVSVREAGLLTPGRNARCRGVIGPPSGPLAAHGYNFARRVFFERLGATGYAFGRRRPLPSAQPPSWFDQQRLRLAAVRADLSAAIQVAAP